MKRSSLMLAALFGLSRACSQQYDPRPNYPKYEGYRSLDYYQDTVRYLKYNWGLEASGVYNGEKLSLFFDRFELPIYGVEMGLDNFGSGELGYIWLYLVPIEQMNRIMADKSADCSKYIILAIYEWGDTREEDQRLKYDYLRQYFPGLNQKGSTVYPWKESYKEILGVCPVYDIQYNFEVEGQPF